MEIMCAACKRPADNLVEFRPSSNFTTYGDLSGGHMQACGTCHMLMTGNKYRQTNWICECDKVTTFKRGETIDVLLREKLVPFIVYVTTSYKKKAYIQALSWRSNRQDAYRMFFEDHFVQVNTRDVKRMSDVVAEAQKREWHKSDLISGPSAVRYADRAFCRLVETVRATNRLLWEVVVFAA